MNNSLVAVTYGRGLFRATPTNVPLLKQVYLPIVIR